jgi:phenylalanyl-tRNA synthetase beta chain
VQPAQAPFVHPGRAASVWSGETRGGWVGELHPTIAASWGFEQPVACFELDLDALAPHAVATPMFTDVTTFPEVREDLAVVVAADVPAERVLEVVRAAGRPLLAAARVFDRYEDAEKLGPGRVSLALRLSYRASDRTLTDDEVAERRAAIAAALREQLEGRVRDS